MNYDTLKTERNTIRTKHREARQTLEGLRLRQDTIAGDIEKARTELVEVTANMQAGEGTVKGVKDAKKALKTLQDESDNLPEKIEIAERTASLLKQKVIEAEGKLSQQARDHYSKKLQPHFDRINDALETINTEIEAVNDYRKDMQADKVGDSVFKGIDRNSQALISKKKLASIETRNFITQIK